MWFTHHLHGVPPLTSSPSLHGVPHLFPSPLWGPSPHLFPSPSWGPSPHPLPFVGSLPSPLPLTFMGSLPSPLPLPFVGFLPLFPSPSWGPSPHLFPSPLLIMYCSCLCSRLLMNVVCQSPSTCLRTLSVTDNQVSKPFQQLWWKSFSSEQLPAVSNAIITATFFDLWEDVSVREGE